MRIMGGMITMNTQYQYHCIDLDVQKIELGNTRGPTMVKHLVKHGNSYALVIDKPILELLGITPDTPLEISTPDGKSLVVTTAFDRGTRVEEATQWMNEAFAADFKTLAG
jgi:antitoxin component of MazEF toxin-antitoxin module